VHVCAVGTETCVHTCLCVSVVVCIGVCSVICVYGGMRRVRLWAYGGVHECGRCCVVRVVEGDRM